MPFLERELLGTLPPLVVNSPCPKMGFSLGSWLVVFLPFSLFGVTGMIPWRLFVFPTSELSGTKSHPVTLFSSDFLLA